MKRYMSFLLVAVIALCSLTFVGCEETVPEEKSLEVLSPVNGSTLSKTHKLEDIDFITTYDTGDYNLERWRITDSKTINMTASVKNLPEGATVLIEHVHIDMSIKSKLAQFDGLTQDSMDDSYHGSSQDGFLVSSKYDYENIFAVEGFSKDLISGWEFICGDYGSGGIAEKRLTEKNLKGAGKVYASKMQVVYDVLIRYKGEEHYHVKSVLDEFLIPVAD